MDRKRVFQIFFRTLFIISGVLLLMFAILLAPLDREPDKGTPHYTQTLHTIDTLPFGNENKAPLKAGWAKVNITPRIPLPLASYGIRGDFEHVHDSIYCRVFVFDNGIKKSAIVTIDLLIFPPVLVARLKEELPTIGFSVENTFFTTTHTHNGPGGWAEGIGGKFLAGTFNEAYVKTLTSCVMLSLQSAEHNLEDASIGFEKYEAKEFIFNRFSSKEEDLDYWLRVLKIRKKSGSTAALVTYAAHPNVLGSKIDHISGDYAGALVDSLENSGQIDFAAFCAGAVAGHRCRIGDQKNYQFIGIISSSLSQKIIPNFDSIPLRDSASIRTLKIPVYLRKPQLKVAQNWKLRPWVFNFLFGKQEIYLSVLELNDVLFIGTPCDFSGELEKEFAKEVNEKKIQLVITGFNGGYIGYIIPDKYYDEDKREARDMNWYGPYSGAYFTEMIKAILQKI